MPGSKILSDLQGKLPHVKLTCTRCDRQETVSVQHLADLYGWHARLPDVRRHLSRDCPNRAADIYRRCDPVFRKVTR